MSKKEGKITLGMLKGKPQTTSFPSIAIRFHANGEQLEELYTNPSDTDQLDESATTASATGINEPDSSPLKYLPRLGKRSTSISIAPKPNAISDASPPSDPWRIFSDIKGKFTKSVEEKITEIRARNHDEAGSPQKNAKTAAKDNSKENSSISDSEELSESSISKTCGVFSTSTTEGAEMSSDDDTPSLEKDPKKPTTLPGTSKSTPSGVRQRFRALKHPKSANQPCVTHEGTIHRTNLARLYHINTDRIEQALPDDENEMEIGIEAMETDALMLRNIDNQYENIDLDGDQVLNVKEVDGSEIGKNSRFWGLRHPRTVYAPVGFVDMRVKEQPTPRNKFVPIVIMSVFLGAYFLIHQYSAFLAGGLIGFTLSFTYYYVTSQLETRVCENKAEPIRPPKEIVEIAPVKEYQPVLKYEGWINELPMVYDPHTYHISQTQSIFLRLQGNLLRMSHTRVKVPKRALWNEPKIAPIFTQHRVYNLLGAKVMLLPCGLAHKRHWSKKYPICIILNQEKQLDLGAADKLLVEDDEDEEELKNGTKMSIIKFPEKKRKFGFRRKNYKVMSQQFSKLTEENEEFELDSEASRTPSPQTPDESDKTAKLIDEVLLEDLAKDELDSDWEPSINPEDFQSLPISPSIERETPIETKLYIFGRTDREKEDWFRRLAAATHKGANLTINDALEPNASISDILIQNSTNEIEYMKYMLLFNKAKKSAPNKDEKHNANTNTNNGEQNSYPDNDDVDVVLQPVVEIQWLNALIGRMLFDYLRDDLFAQRIKDRIQRKLTSIKLPYFIEELLVTELQLGDKPPLLHRASRPVIDERGLWIDLDITYTGLMVLILQTKLNLMKLKQPQKPNPNRAKERPAMFHSDVDDSAESTSDEEWVTLHEQVPVLDTAGLPMPGLGGTSNASKKLIKMVDRIAESKFFKAASEYRYIKKAMEGVSNTDLRLKVEIRELVGTLVLNMPAPPSDRMWVGFRPTPDLNLSAHPIVGERNISYLRITSWIERKLLQEFQKLLVIPNMEDVSIPGMSSDLPL